MAVNNFEELRFTISRTSETLNSSLKNSNYSMEMELSWLSAALCHYWWESAHGKQSLFLFPSLYIIYYDCDCDWLGSTQESLQSAEHNWSQLSENTTYGPGVSKLVGLLTDWPIMPHYINCFYRNDKDKVINTTHLSVTVGSKGQILDSLLSLLIWGY